MGVNRCTFLIFLNVIDSSPLFMGWFLKKKKELEQLAALVLVNQPKKCQQNLQFVEEEEYGLRDEKNDIEKVNPFKMPDLYRTRSTRQVGVSIVIKATPTLHQLVS